MHYLIYFALTLTATTIGAITGFGGGVIIKPIMDLLNGYDAQTIGLLSSVTVFTMALVTLCKQLKQKTRVDFRVILPLSAGSMLGGLAGEGLFTLVFAGESSNSEVLVLQNTLLCLVLAAVFMYTVNRKRFKTYNIRGIFAIASAGFLLGSLSSFLSIGGGPINVAAIMLLFSYDAKMAAVGSIATILFSQASKISLTLFSGGLGAYDLAMLPTMMSAAILGGYLGAILNKKMQERTVLALFYGVQIFVCVIAIINIFRNIG